MTDENETLYPHIVRAVFGTPWAVLPETMQVIAELVTMRSQGARLSDEEIDARLAAAAERQGPRNGPRKGVVAVVPVYGTIMPRGGMMARMSGGTSVEGVRAMLDEALANPDAAAVMLDVDSPGGQVDGVFELATYIRERRQSAGGDKPIVATANTLMASAAYLIASAADEIVATPSSQVGSVGVVYPHVDISANEALTGRKTTLITAGKYKAEASPYEPLSDEARAAIQEKVDGYYDMMVNDIARGRGVKVDAVRAGYGQGRTLLAKGALSAGMIDRIETFDATVRRLARGGVARSDRSSYDGTDASPGTGLESFADRLMLAAEEVEVVVARARDRAALRAEEGRTLSDDDVAGLERIAGLRPTLSEAERLIATKFGPDVAEAARTGSLKAVLDARLEAYRRGYNVKKETETT